MTSHYVDHQPGDGYRYVVLVSPLPHKGFQGGGTDDTHCVVTVWPPTVEPYGRTYVLGRTGVLTDHYVDEKFCGGHPPLSDQTNRHMADAIREALERPA